MESSIANLFASLTSLLGPANPDTERPPPTPHNSDRSVTSDDSLGELLIMESPANLPANPYDCHVLGVFYDCVSYPVRRRHEYSLYWFSYRSMFPNMTPYPISTDAGWGCMLRASQMMLAETLRRDRRGRAWQPMTADSGDKFDDEILTSFADDPSKQCQFSIHNLCRAGLNHDKYPGEWVGPQIACLLLRDVMPSSKMQVFVADGGNLYVEEVEKYMRIEEFPPSPPPPPDNLASSSSSGGFDPLCNPPPRSDFPEPCWSGSLLLLVPLRFGNVKTMGSLSAARRAKLVDYFKIEAGVGVLGGTPRHAIWFYGCDVGDSTQQGENNTLYGLDPHTVQFAPKVGKDGRVVLSKEYRKSVHTNGCCINLNDIDPTCALGFYCKDRSSFQELVAILKEGICNKREKGALFGVEEVRPDYESNLGAMDDLMGGCDEDQEDALSDEDDFVII